MDRYLFEWEGVGFVADYGAETIALQTRQDQPFHFADMDDNQDGLLTFCFTPANNDFFAASVHPYRVKNAYVLGIPETVSRAMSFSVIDPNDFSKTKYRMKIEGATKERHTPQRHPGKRK